MTDEEPTLPPRWLRLLALARRLEEKLGIAEEGDE